MGNGASGFAISILIFFLAMLSFFIAFHPSGSQPAQNPSDLLSWLIGQYETAAGNTSNIAAVTPLTPPQQVQVQLWLFQRLGQMVLYQRQQLRHQFHQVIKL